RYLATLPYVDKDRIGIYGWSFGGYLTLLAMTLGADYFKLGVSGAPVTKWELYDAIYTERYMRTPDVNPDGYGAASVFTHLDMLKGKLLLIHGMSDDNVHVQNSMQLVEAMQKAGKRFELMVYPGKDHGVAGEKTKLHLWKTMSEFIFENL
ncbi:MAG: prolyl oligopeptidase family serine peptidase, partial [Candidatus Zixiibacteriota bacterium]